MGNIANYTIQDWLFSEAEGAFDIDLAESGIQYHYFDDLPSAGNVDLNYSIDRGQYALRSRIANEYNVSIDNVMITHGSQEALYLFYNVILQKGDHVITFSPGWQQSWEVPKHCGADVSTVKLRSDLDFDIDLEDFTSALKDNTRLVILNSPNNPTGVSVSESKLKELVAICECKGIVVINDEEYLTEYPKSIVHYDGETAAVSSLSKVYGFPGLRIGWFIGPSKWVNAMVNMKRYITVTNSSLCEYLATDIMSRCQGYLSEYRELLKTRYPIFQSYLKDCHGLRLIEAMDTPFAYILLPKGMNSWDFSRVLLRHEKVLVMPAEVFQHQEALRISFVRNEDILNDGLSKMTRFFHQYTSGVVCER